MKLTAVPGLSGSPGFPLAAAYPPVFSLFVLVLLLSGCHTYPLGAPGPGEPTAASARPVKPLPDELTALYTPDHPGYRLRFQPIDSAGSYDRYSFQFETFSEVYLDFRAVTGVFYSTRL